MNNICEHCHNTGVVPCGNCAETDDHSCWIDGLEYGPNKCWRCKRIPATPDRGEQYADGGTNPGDVHWPDKERMKAINKEWGNNVEYEPATPRFDVV